MLDTDSKAFFELLTDAWSLKGQVLTGGAKALFFRALAAYPLDIVRGALSAHFADPKRGQYLPMPADVIAQIERALADDGRPGAEEAWALALRSADEADTVVWTSETAEAFGVCRPILEARDKVGARMAFREAYERLVDEARRARRRPTWLVSEGFDPAMRVAAITDAVHRGLLASNDFPMLPAPRAAVALLENSTESGIPDFAREALLSLRKWLTTPTEGPSPAEIEQERTRAAKAETAAKFAAYQRERARSDVPSTPRQEA